MFTKVLNAKQFVFVEPWINVSIMVSVMKLFTRVYIFLASVTSSQTINWTIDRKLDPESLYWFCGTHFLWKLLSGESMHKKKFSNLFILQQYIMVHHSNTECCYIQCYNENGWNMLHYKCIRKEKMLYHKDQCSVYICILPTYWFDLYSMQNFKNANINI